MDFGPVHMDPGQVSDPGVSFASVHSLSSVTVNKSFRLPQGKLGRRFTRCSMPSNPPADEQKAKVARDQSRFAHVHC